MNIIVKNYSYEEAVLVASMPNSSCPPLFLLPFSEFYFRYLWYLTCRCRGRRRRCRSARRKIEIRPRGHRRHSSLRHPTITSELFIISSFRFAYLQQNPSRLAWFCKSEQLFMLCPLNDGQELGAGPANQIGQGVAPSPWRYCCAGLPSETLISCRRQITAIHSELAPLLPPPRNWSSRSVTKVSRCVICM